MSPNAAAGSAQSKGRTAKVGLGLLLTVLAGVGIAYAGTAPLRYEESASGLLFRTVEAGSGPVVQAMDGVLIEYEGRLTDGTVFDTSEGRGPTPMIASQVIPGFAEALQKMQKGGRYTIRIPARLGYGANSPSPAIPANSDLVFDVEVVEVVPNAALMMQGGPPPTAPQPQR
jgi:FKBP-type peptidyl-prolyl cis-trans isomerase FkpA